jgi:hypothetical protein
VANYSHRSRREPDELAAAHQFPDGGRGDPFENIGNQDHRTLAMAQSPRDVGRPRITTTSRIDVDAMTSSSEPAYVDAADEIPGEDG